MKTTQQLIELQRSITQGEWKYKRGIDGFNIFRKDGEEFADEIAKAYMQLKESKTKINKYEQDLPPTEANATAIALVPELLAEVIRLREALTPLEHLYRGQLTNTGEYYPQLLDTARALLADAK